jgi:hypothetical protein
MGRLDRLPVLADLHARPRAIPKPSTKLERAIAKKAARLLDVKLLRAWALAVKTRDVWKDRKTGKRVHSSRQLDPDRAEAHHIEPKENPATRYDIRNGVTLSLATHEAVEHHRYRIEGTAWFKKNGARYVDATFPISFSSASNPLRARSRSPRPPRFSGRLSGASPSRSPGSDTFPLADSCATRAASWSRFDRGRRPNPMSRC